MRWSDPLLGIHLPPAWARGIQRSALAIGSAAVALLLRRSLDPLLYEHALFTLMTLAVAFSAVFGGLAAGLLCTATGAVLGVAFLMRRGWEADVGLVLQLMLFVLLGVVISTLAQMLHRSRGRALRHEESLAQANGELAGVLSSITDCYLRVNREYTITDTNDRAAQYVGSSRTDLLGRTLWDIFLHQPGSPTRQHTDLAMHERRPVAFETCCPNSIDRWAEVHAYPSADGGLSVYFRDISDRKRAELALLDSQDRLREALAEADHYTRQLEQARAAADEASYAKDRFLAMLSHELRTPLTPALAVADMLLRRHAPPELREYLEMIRRNVALEARLIDDLLDVTRIARGKLELRAQVVDVNAVLRQAAEVCAPDIDAKGLALTLEDHAANRWMSGDPSRLQQVFWNLIKNAVKFTPRGGRIAVHSADQGNDAVLVEVSDTGVGIAPEVLPRVFNAFEQGGRGVTRQFGGLGLGLAISRALVELHGGTLTAHSDGPSRGATFRVVLPAKAAAPAAPAPSGQPHSGEARPPRSRILLVEDHADTARVMSQLLAADGHDVTTAHSVSAALERALDGGFDLLVSDLGLPDGSGLELMRELRHRQESLRGIALSGYGSDEDLQRSREAGFEEHLVKPVDMNRLEQVITRITSDSDRH